jgi:hypothetical protein
LEADEHCCLKEIALLGIQPIWFPSRGLPKIGLVKYPNGIMYNPNHQLYYFPNMTANEVVLIKTFDSGIAWYTLHIAFNDPTMSFVDASLQQSIKTSHSFVFF